MGVEGNLAALSFSGRLQIESRPAAAGKIRGSKLSSCNTPLLPYHDWNERVTAECYLPDGAARILQSRIARIVNNLPAYI